MDVHPPPSVRSHSPDELSLWAAYQSADPSNHPLTENESMARRLRQRPTAEQTEVLLRAYSENSYPSPEQCEALAETVGMYVQPDFEAIVH